MKKNKKLFKNENEGLKFTILVCVIFLVALMFYMIGKDSGYSQYEKHYEELNKEDVTEYDLYIEREKNISIAILVLSFGLMLGFTIHGFSIITVNK